MNKINPALMQRMRQGVASEEGDTTDTCHTLSLHEYHLCHPESTPVPTMTQNGLIGLVLDRQQCKVYRLARRHAMWIRTFAAIRNALHWVWRILTAPARAILRFFSKRIAMDKQAVKEVVGIKGVGSEWH